MRILVVGDLHGRKPVIRDKDFDAMVLVGDVCDDRDLSPIYQALFRGSEEAEGLSTNEFFIKKAGGKRNLRKLEKNSLRKGKEILKYLDTFGKPMFMVAGNWDQSYGKSRIKHEEKNRFNYLKTFYDFYLGEEINFFLTRGIKNLRNCMFHCHEFNDINFIGYGLSSGPEDILRRRKKNNFTNIQIEKLTRACKKIENKLSGTYKNRKNKKIPTFFITHNVPYNTKLDIIKNKDNYLYKKHFGSMVARNFCSKYQPLICVGGHIHEHRGKDKIKNTLVINTGYGRYSQVMIDIDEKKGKVKKVEFVK